MFLVNKEDKKIHKIDDISFKECGLKERSDLQEWICNNPDILGEELLIIQKEFDGFCDTHERLDLLAIDKIGNLVIIENKLDDSGRDTVWQAMKYAGYCSSLKKDDIKNIYQKYLDKNGVKYKAEEIISEFLDKPDYSEIELNQKLSQRIILVAKEFRKEVTNTVIWARDFGVNIKCIKIIPFKINNLLIVDTDQIIPVKDIAEITISYEQKSLDEAKNRETRANAEIVRNKFWHQFLQKFNEKSNLFSGRNTEIEYKDHWLSTGSGIGEAGFSFVVCKAYVGIELAIGGKSKDENKKFYDYLYKSKEEIDNTFGKKLEWDRLDDKKMSRVSYINRNVSVFNEEDWNTINQFLTDSMIKLEKALKPYIDRYPKSNKTKEL